MKKIISSHVIDPTNIGDLYSAPSHYFDFPGYQVEPLDIRHITPENIQGKDVIVGGGGLLFTRFHDSFQKLVSHKKHSRLISWGIGQQIYGTNKFDEIKKFDYQAYIQGFDLVGIRDSDYLDNWVPCVSCMHPSFDRKRDIKHEFVVFSHKKFQLNFPEFPTMTNNHQSIDEIFDFLGSGETIITSSYHGAYWGTLLGRKVLAFPFSSKFYTLKHLPVLYPVKKWFEAKFKVSIFNKTLFESPYENKFLCNQDNWRNYLKDCRAYPDSLQENRDRNIWYYSKVMELLAS